MSENEGGSGPGPAADHATATDVALLHLVSEGNGSALEALYDRYGRKAYALALRILGDEQLSQDVVQEVFVTVWRDSARYDGKRGTFGSWLLAMTHHKSVDLVRREENQRRRRVGLDAVSQQESGDPDVVDEVWATLRSERVRRALRELPESQREALILAYFGGYTQREVSGITGVPLGTVKTRMLAGVRRLYQCLHGQEEGS